ncbi:MAG: S8 family serine peptidase [SAR202 cluster bacterium]|nr:S8 family serine peptidase [SAR202 cluster bacterium]
MGVIRATHHLEETANIPIDPGRKNFSRALALVAIAAVVAVVSWVGGPLALTAGPAHAQTATTTSPTLPAPVKHAKFSSNVALLAEYGSRLRRGRAASISGPTTGDAQVQAMLDGGLLRMDDAGRVQLYVRLARPGPSAMADLEASGAVIEIEDASRALVQLTISVDRLSDIEMLDSVASVRLPIYGRTNAGSKLTEGDAALSFDELRSGQGVSGAGVTVGLISDGIFGIADALALGDLPASALNRDGGGKLVSTTGGVAAVSFRADGDLEAGLSSGSNGAEGTAMLEIVHDIAPGASLRFANFATDIEFNAAVAYLAATSDIVIDDIAWFGLAYDQSSSISANTAAMLNLLANPIRGYYTSVGNHAQRHYQEPFTDSGQDGTALVGLGGALHRFEQTADTTDCRAFGPGVSNYIDLFNGWTATVFLSWDDTFGAAANDYDIFVRDGVTGVVVASGITDNPGVTLDPLETVAFTNTSGVKRTYEILAQNSANLASPKTIEMFVFGGVSCPDGSKLNFNTLSSSVPAQGDAGGGVVSVGAINASDSGLDTIESFSSRRPTNNGALKPDVSAVDGVSVTGSGGFSSSFFGTSASAPHVAALAALLLELQPALQAGESGDNPAADRSTLRAAIVDTAIDLGDPGPDNTFGSGRVNGALAGQSLVPAPQPVPSLSASGLVAAWLAMAIVVATVLRRKRVVRSRWSDARSRLGQ